jgi:protoporphyrinogen oxidase
VDGSFLYPRGGIGAIALAFEKALPRGAVRTDSQVTGLRHEGGRITGVVAGGRLFEPVDQVVSSLPVSILPGLLDPAPPDEVATEVARLRFRNVRLVAVFLARGSVGDSATMYFPDPGLPFTRAAEPRNRCSSMAPTGCTSLIAEVPCGPDDEAWTAAGGDVERAVVDGLVRVGLVEPSEVIGSTSHRLGAAYPVLDRDAVDAVGRVTEWLGRFENLHLTGRGGLFMYGWIHDMVRGGFETVQKIAPSATETTLRAAR